MKHELHKEMNKKLRSKKDRSQFLYANTGKYHVSELTESEIDKCLYKLSKLKSIRRFVWA